MLVLLTGQYVVIVIGRDSSTGDCVETILIGLWILWCLEVDLGDDLGDSFKDPRE